MQKDQEEAEEKQIAQKKLYQDKIPPPKIITFQNNTNSKFEKRYWFNGLAVIVFILEAVSLGDMITDLYLLSKLVVTNNPGWATSLCLCMLNPYLIMYAPLVSYLIRKNIFKGRFGQFFGLIFLTILSMIFILLLDILSAIFSLIGNIISPFYKGSGDDLLEIIFRKVGFSTMDIIGIRKLRSISQLLFETSLQLLLQLRMLQYKDIAESFGVNINALLLSLQFALLHFFIEGTVLILESTAFKANFTSYLSTCLNGRLLWIPFIDLMMYPEKQNKDEQPKQIKQQKQITNEKDEKNKDDKINIYLKNQQKDLVIDMEQLNLNQNLSNQVSLIEINNYRKVSGNSEISYAVFGQKLPFINMNFKSKDEVKNEDLDKDKKEQNQQQIIKKFGFKVISFQKSEVKIGLCHAEILKKENNNNQQSDYGFYTLSSNREAHNFNYEKETSGFYTLAPFDYYEGDEIMCEYNPIYGSIKYTYLKTFETFTLNQISVVEQHPLYICCILGEGNSVEILDEQQISQRFENMKKIQFNFDDIYVKLFKKFKNKIDYIFSDETLTKMSYQIFDLPEENDVKDRKNIIIVDESVKNVSIQTLFTFIIFSNKRIWLNYQRAEIANILNLDKTFDHQFVSSYYQYIKSYILPVILGVNPWGEFKIRLLLELFSSDQQIVIDQSILNRLEITCLNLEKYHNIVIQQNQLENIITSKNQLSNLQAKNLQISLQQIRDYEIVFLGGIIKNLTTKKQQHKQLEEQLNSIDINDFILPCLYSKRFDKIKNVELHFNQISLKNFIKNFDNLYKQKLEDKIGQLTINIQDYFEFTKDIEKICITLLKNKNLTQFVLKIQDNFQFSYIDNKIIIEFIKQYQAQDDQSIDFNLFIESLQNNKQWENIVDLKIIFNNQTDFSQKQQSKIQNLIKLVQKQKENIKELSIIFQKTSITQPENQSSHNIDDDYENSDESESESVSVSESDSYDEENNNNQIKKKNKNIQDTNELLIFQKFSTLETINQLIKTCENLYYINFKIESQIQIIMNKKKFELNMMKKNQAQIKETLSLIYSLQNWNQIDYIKIFYEMEQISDQNKQIFNDLNQVTQNIKKLSIDIKIQQVQEAEQIENLFKNLIEKCSNLEELNLILGYLETTFDYSQKHLQLNIYAQNTFNFMNIIKPLFKTNFFNQIESLDYQLLNDKFLQFKKQLAKQPQLQKQSQKKIKTEIQSDFLTYFLPFTKQLSSIQLNFALNFPEEEQQMYKDLQNRTSILLKDTQNIQKLQINYAGYFFIKLDNNKLEITNQEDCAFNLVSPLTNIFQNFNCWKEVQKIQIILKSHLVSPMLKSLVQQSKIHFNRNDLQYFSLNLNLIQNHQVSQEFYDLCDEIIQPLKTIEEFNYSIDKFQFKKSFKKCVLQISDNLNFDYSKTVQNIQNSEIFKDCSILVYDLIKLNIINEKCKKMYSNNL
ncbi:hypothetical protein PPERSA_04546 [Pseudocohnilembus persalinus]|uniref:Uncharacterized protein n=1 Tax=Pseudocohnilembus persalinus TaxID=266149 RepID=A0A0V0QEA7_PSEPJ|nr:hypothetical protein PPERSA_04546 [Pseudocohnilembus persalinus]|eukprot:KRX00525.1 hypothetical protein PPERSA_04546 [Pseudocohnilembus persalinus]